MGTHARNASRYPRGSVFGTAPVYGWRLKGSGHTLLNPTPILFLCDDVEHGIAPWRSPLWTGARLRRLVAGAHAVPTLDEPGGQDKGPSYGTQAGSTMSVAAKRWTRRSMRGGCPSRRRRRCTACAILSLAITLPDSLGSSRPGMLTGTPSGQARAIPMSPAPLEPTWLNPEGRHVGLDRLGDGYRITDEMAGPAKRRYRGSRIPGRPVSHPRERAPKPSDRHRSPERCCTRARTSPGPPPPATRDTGADDAAQPEARQPGSWDSGRMRRS